MGSIDPFLTWHNLSTWLVMSSLVPWHGLKPIGSKNNKNSIKILNNTKFKKYFKIGKIKVLRVFIVKF